MPMMPAAWQNPGVSSRGLRFNCTNLHYDEISAALASANASRLATRSDLAAAIFQERAGDSRTNPDADFGVQVSRIIFM